jgi:hypothetical protein
MRILIISSKASLKGIIKSREYLQREASHSGTRVSAFGIILLMMARLGFRQFSPQAWESVWVDLRLESSELRKRFNGKWRNALLSAEKDGLHLEADTDDTLLAWMMERYR